MVKIGQAIRNIIATRLLSLPMNISLKIDQASSPEYKNRARLLAVPVNIRGESRTLDIEPGYFHYL